MTPCANCGAPTNGGLGYWRPHRDAQPPAPVCSSACLEAVKREREGNYILDSLLFLG